MSERGRFSTILTFGTSLRRATKGKSKSTSAYSNVYGACLVSLAFVIAISFVAGWLLRERIATSFKDFSGVREIEAVDNPIMAAEKLKERRREEQLLTAFLLDPESLITLSEEDRARIVRAVNRLYRDFAAGPQISAERALNRLALLRLSLTRLAGLEIALKARLEVGGDPEALLELRKAVSQTKDRIDEHALAYVRDLVDLKYRSSTAAASCSDVISILSDRYATGNTGARDSDARILAPRPLNLNNETQSRLIEILETHCIALNPPSESLVTRAMCQLFPPAAIRPELCGELAGRQARL
jgi:hypothetical protein